MIFQYNKYIFNIKFKQKIVFNTLPSFIFRNNIGFQLRKIVCVLRNSDCSVCILNATCIYPLMFETPIDKNNSFLKGRNRAPHPYVIYSEAKPEEKLDGLNLEIILIGSGIKYFPYIILAIMNVGKTGILRKRVQFDYQLLLLRKFCVYNLFFDYRHYFLSVSKDLSDFLTDGNHNAGEIKSPAKNQLC